MLKRRSRRRERNSAKVEVLQSPVVVPLGSGLDTITYARDVPVGRQRTVLSSTRLHPVWVCLPSEGHTSGHVAALVRVHAHAASRPLFALSGSHSMHFMHPSLYLVLEKSPSVDGM
jgi:hypothetical protein